MELSELVVQKVEWKVELVVTVFEMTQQRPVHKDQVDDRRPQNFVGCHQCEWANLLVHEKCNAPFPERTQGAIGRSPAPLRPPVGSRRSAYGRPRNGEEATYEC